MGIHHTQSLMSTPRSNPRQDVASPKIPSPVPKMKGWTKSGTRLAHFETARSNSVRLPHIQLGPLYNASEGARRFCGFQDERKKVPRHSYVVGVMAAAVSGTLKPASRAAWTCTHLSRARSTLSPQGPANIQSGSSDTLLDSHTAAFVHGNNIPDHHWR